MPKLCSEITFCRPKGSCFLSRSQRYRTRCTKPTISPVKKLVLWWSRKLEQKTRPLCFSDVSKYIFCCEGIQRVCPQREAPAKKVTGKGKGCKAEFMPRGSMMVYLYTYIWLMFMAYGKCRQIYHTWILWDVSNFCWDIPKKKT